MPAPLRLVTDEHPSSGPSQAALEAAARLVRLYPELDAPAALRLIVKGAVRA
jgi:hypothetical protein